MVLMFAGLAGRGAVDPRALGALAPRPAARATGALVTLAVVAALVRGHRAAAAAAPSSSASVGQDMLAQGRQRRRSDHWAPPGFYSLAFFATFWPGAILAAIAAPFAWREPARGRGRLPAGLDRSGLARVRGRADQAAALRAAALPGRSRS